MDQNCPTPLRFTDCHGRIQSFLPEDILYVAAENACSRIVCPYRAVSVRHPLIQIQELLPDHFLRVHRSFLVNRSHITHLFPRVLFLSNGDRLPVPKEKYNWLRDLLDEDGKQSGTA